MSATMIQYKDDASNVTRNTEKCDGACSAVPAYAFFPHSSEYALAFCERCTQVHDLASGEKGRLIRLDDAEVVLS